MAGMLEMLLVNEWSVKVLLKSNGNVLHAIIFILNITLPVTCIEMTVVKSFFQNELYSFLKTEKM